MTPRTSLFSWVRPNEGAVGGSAGRKEGKGTDKL